MIDINSFNMSLTNLLENQSVKNEEDFANKFVTLYHNTMRTATQAMYGNMLSKTNKNIMLSMTKNAFNLMKKDMAGNLVKLGISMLQQAMILYWTSATFLSAIPPPGSVKIISNIVTFPGNVLQINITNGQSINQFVNSINLAIKTQMATISGICISLTPIGTSLIPILYPFTGVI